MFCLWLVYTFSPHSLRLDYVKSLSLVQSRRLTREETRERLSEVCRPIQGPSSSLSVAGETCQHRHDRIQCTHAAYSLFIRPISK